MNVAALFQSSAPANGGSCYPSYEELCQYREYYENESQWNARRMVLLHNWQKYKDKDRLVSLSLVWANNRFMGNKYSAGVTALLDQLSLESAAASLAESQRMCAAETPHDDTEVADSTLQRIESTNSPHNMPPNVMRLFQTDKPERPLIDTSSVERFDVQRSTDATIAENQPFVPETNATVKQPLPDSYYSKLAYGMIPVQFIKAETLPGTINQTREQNGHAQRTEIGEYLSRTINMSEKYERTEIDLSGFGGNSGHVLFPNLNQNNHFFENEMSESWNGNGISSPVPFDDPSIIEVVDIGSKHDGESMTNQTNKEVERNILVIEFRNSLEGEDPISSTKPKHKFNLPKHANTANPKKFKNKARGFILAPSFDAYKTNPPATGRFDLSPLRDCFNEVTSSSNEDPILQQMKRLGRDLQRSFDEKTFISRKPNNKDFQDFLTTRLKFDLEFVYYELNTQKKVSSFQCWANCCGIKFPFHVGVWVCNVYINKVYVSYGFGAKKTEAHFTAVTSAFLLLRGRELHITSSRRLLYDPGSLIYMIEEKSLTGCLKDESPAMGDLPPKFVSSEEFQLQKNPPKNNNTASNLLPMEKPKPVQSNQPNVKNNTVKSTSPYQLPVATKEALTNLEEFVSDLEFYLKYVFVSYVASMDDLDPELSAKLGKSVFTFSNKVHISKFQRDEFISMEIDADTACLVIAKPTRDCSPVSMNDEEDTIDHLVSDFIVLKGCRQRSTYVQILTESCRFCNKTLRISCLPVRNPYPVNNRYECLVSIDGVEIVHSVQPGTKKTARANIAECAVRELEKTYPVLMFKSRPADLDLSEGQTNLREGMQLDTHITNDNIGNILLRKMGWSGTGGLGQNEDGIATPIQVKMRPKRVGLGCKKKPGTEDIDDRFDDEEKLSDLDEDDYDLPNGFSSADMRHALENYGRYGVNGLVFSYELDNLERKEVHEFAASRNLHSKSYGKKDENRFVTVKKSFDVGEFVRDINEQPNKRLYVDEGYFELIYPI